MNFIDIILYTGIFVFACTGALKARTNRMDIFGAAVLAFATAYGGGTIRDLLIGIPVNWMNDYLALALVVSAVMLVFVVSGSIERFKYTLFFTDAIGLGMFTIAGIERSLSHGVNPGYALLMGVMSATFGGLIADILSNKVPALLKKGELYATVCIVGGILYLLLEKLGWNQNVNIFICVLVVVLLRVFSKRKHLSLPQMK